MAVKQSIFNRVNRSDYSFVKAKFHYAIQLTSWFEAKFDYAILVADRFDVRSWFEPVCDQLRTCFEPARELDSIMEFGFNRALTHIVKYSNSLP